MGAASQRRAESEAPDSRAGAESAAAATAKLVETNSDMAAVSSTRRVLFIGIAGPSCGGKSELARQLSSCLGSPLKAISSDGYFRPDRMPEDPRFGLNWETPEGIDFEGLKSDLRHLQEVLRSEDHITQPKLVNATQRGRAGGVLRPEWQGRSLSPLKDIVVVVEGFLLFHDAELASMFDATFWIEVDCDTCCERRHMRDAPHVPKSRFKEWYEGLVWSHFERYQAKQLANAPSAHSLNGTDTREDVAKHAEKACWEQLGLLEASATRGGY